VTDYDVIGTMQAVEEGASKLAALSDQLAEAIRVAAIAETAYEGAFEKELLRIYHDAKRAGERIPAEDVRKALAHEAVDDGVYAAHLMARANLAATDKQMRGLSAAVSARQSLLKVGQ
jgi:hypothetical protein